MKISDWLFEAMIELKEAGVDSPRRDALVLLEKVLDKDRPWVLAHHDHELSEQDLNEVNKFIERRKNREPLAYIRGKAWFYKRLFIVTPDVLIPRPESEDIITLAKELKPKNAIDVGTGSGCLAITLKLESPETEVMATDVSESALKVCNKNIKELNVDVDVRKNNLLDSVDLQEVDLIVANLPYVPENLKVEPELKTEPKLALFSGKDGLNHYKKFWSQIKESEFKPKHIITESLTSQHKEMTELAKQSGYTLEKTQSLTQLFTKNS